MTDKEKDNINNTIMASIGNQFKRVYGLINLNDDTIFFQNYTDEPIILSKFIKDSLDFYVYVDDRPIISEVFNLQKLKEEFAMGKDVITVRYRLRNGTSFSWVKTVIFPSINFSEKNPELVLFSYDNHTETLEELIVNQRFQMELLNERKKRDISESFYDDILDVLRTLTEPYLLFATVNLRNDVFLSYQTKEYINVPYSNLSGRYEETMRDYVKKNFMEDEIDNIISFLSINSLRTKLSMQNEVYIGAKDKKNRTIKIRALKRKSKGNVPIKIHLAFIVDNEDASLLIIKTFGNFEVIGKNNQPVKFEKKQSKQVLAYLVDKRGYPITLKDIIFDVLEKNETDLNAQKYASALVRKAVSDLSKAGYDNIVISENHTYRINKEAIDCDYYHLLDGNSAYWYKYTNEYMKEYSWAEETNAEIQLAFGR